MRILHAGHADREPCAAAEDPDPTEAAIRDAIGGNICRCTGYQQIVEAVQIAARRLAEEPGND